MTADLWVAGNPLSPGWYATLHSWDSDEGAFAGAHYWDGKIWRIWDSGPASTSDYGITNLPIFVHSAQTFADCKQAETWADENDPGF